MAKRYYWLKLNENFFERDEIKIIENSPNGKDYIIFYLKLLLKSISSEGKLKFRNVIPYTPEMLSSITGTNIDTVMVATKMFVDLGLMEKWDDGTMFMAETQNMIGSETGWAKKKREYRKQIEGEKRGQCPQLVPEKKDEVRQEKEIEKDIDIELDKERETKEKNLSLGTTEVLNFIEEKACISLSGQYQNISELVEKYEIQDIKEAISKSLSKGKKGVAILNYANGILKNWAVEGKEESHGGNTGSIKQDFTEGKYKGFKPKPPDVSGEIDETGLI